MRYVKHFLIMVMFFSSSVVFCHGLKDITLPKEFVEKIQELRNLDIRDHSIIDKFKENIAESARAKEIVSELAEKIKYGALFQSDLDKAIVAALKVNIENGLLVEKIIDSYGNTIMHESLNLGSIEISRIILDALKKEQAKELLNQRNGIFKGSFHDSCFNQTPFLVAISRGKMEQAFELLNYAEIHFGDDFVREMVLAKDSNSSFSLHYELSFPLAQHILYYLRNDDVRELVNTRNDLGTTPLKNVKISTLATGYYQHHNIHPPVVMAFSLRFQAQYKMSLEEVCKEFYGDYKEGWKSFYEGLKKCEERYLLKY